LNKLIASSGECSRRKADDLIAAGRVSINGRIVTALGTKVDPEHDQVMVGDRQICPAASRESNLPTYLALNKPVRTITSTSDPQGRTTVLDLLPERMQGQRLLPVGRLDFMSEGLLLLTNNGELLHRLTHAGWHVPKTYRVCLRGRLDSKILETFRTGMTLREGDVLAPVQIEGVEAQSRKTWLELTLLQGRNRQIRRMCRDMGLTILRLMRTRQGPIELGDLPSGGFRSLDRQEVQSLLEATGLSDSSGTRHGMQS